MHKLTLTKSEREAIDFIGYRYNTGDSFYELLIKCEFENESDSWDSDSDITFIIPEYIAWEIRDLFIEEQYTFPLLSDQFVTKLLEFESNII